MKALIKYILREDLLFTIMRIISIVIMVLIIYLMMRQ